MRYVTCLFRITLLALLLCAANTAGLAQGKDPVTEAQKSAKEAKDQQAKAEEAAKKLDCDKPKSKDKNALVDAVKKAQAAAKDAQGWADKAQKSAEEAGKTADANPKNEKAKEAKGKADQTAKDAQTAANEAAAAAKAALDQAPGMAAAAALGKELDKANTKGNSKKPEAIERLKKAAQQAAEANPCDPEEVKRVVRVELEKIKKDFSGNGELKPWIESLGDKLKNDHLISMPATGQDALVFTAQGTGRTTGHIADLTVFNPTDQALTVAIGPCFIPTDGAYQPYIVPDIPRVSVQPHATSNIPLYGYCADIFTAPAPAGGPLPPVTSWITINEPVSALPGSLASGTTWQPTAANGWQPASSGAALVPGTTTPLGHTIDLIEHPAEAARILLDALRQIAQAYDNLKGSGAITTPFSGNPEKERESVIQQTFWIYAAEISGKDYTAKHFRDNTIRQFETATGQAFNKTPATQQKQIEQGALDFWNTFQAVGTQAKVLAAAPR